MQERWVQPLGQEGFLEKAMAPHSSTLAWKIPWTEDPGRLKSIGSRRVGHDWATSLSFSCIGEGNGNPLQCFCLENPRDGGAWRAAVYGVTQSRTRLKRLSSSSSSSIGLWCRSMLLQRTNREAPKKLVGKGQYIRFWWGGSSMQSIGSVWHSLAYCKQFHCKQYLKCFSLSIQCQLH